MLEDRVLKGQSCTENVIPTIAVVETAVAGINVPGKNHPRKIVSHQELNGTKIKIPVTSMH